MFRPPRTELLAQLDRGTAGALILVDGPDAAVSDQAESQVRDAIALAAAGKIQPIGIPGAANDEPPEAFDVGFLRLSRGDPHERWLTAMLLSIEPDLAGIEQPMVFAVYGRGRAMEPWVGAGIQSAGLAEDVAYVVGACSCEVKDQSRGVDLLTTWDWEQSAIAMADRIGEETGNEQLLSSGELLSAVIIGSGGDATTDSSRPTQASPNSASGARVASTALPKPKPVAKDLAVASAETSASRTSSTRRRPTGSIGLILFVTVLALAIGSVLIAKRREPAIGDTPQVGR